MLEILKCWWWDLAGGGNISSITLPSHQKERRKKGGKRKKPLSVHLWNLELISLIHPDIRVETYNKINTSHTSFWTDALFLGTLLSIHVGILLYEAAGCTIIMIKEKLKKKERNGVRGDEGYLSKRQVLRPILTDTALPAFRWLPWIVIFVPPENGPRDGITRVKYGDWGHTHTHTFSVQAHSVIQWCYSWH